MIEETKSMPTENDNHTNEFLLKLNSDRMSGLESALERNWIAHLLLAGIGLALVLPIGKFRISWQAILLKDPMIKQSSQLFFWRSFFIIL